jgi:RNA polymerase sigma-70 factor (ECF subfamily)
LNTKQLIEKCKQNDYSAQLAVYNAYKNMMYGAAVRILKSREEAEDVVQECFIKGFQKIHQLKEDANLGAWLKRIVVIKSLDIVRENKKITWVEETLILEKEPTPEEENLSDVSVDFVKKCINQLKEKYSIVLTLYLIEEYNHREIGELLSIKESTVRNQFKRGKAQLLQLLKNT